MRLQTNTALPALPLNTIFAICCKNRYDSYVKLVIDVVDKRLIIPNY